MAGTSKLTKLLSSFSCEKNRNIENFLWEKSISFENLSKTRTYLVFNQEQLEASQNLMSVQIYGYISLSLKVLTIPQSISNRMRKELDGFSAKIRGEVIADFPCYLIGQLSRNSKVDKTTLSGEQLLHFADDIIAASVNAVGGRYMMIECNDNKNLMNFYKRNGFTEIAHIPDKNQPMIQMIKKII